MDGNINSLNFSINRKQKHPEVEGSLEKVKKKKSLGKVLGAMGRALNSKSIAQPRLEVCTFFSNGLCFY